MQLFKHIQHINDDHHLSTLDSNQDRDHNTLGKYYKILSAKYYKILYVYIIHRWGLT